MREGVFPTAWKRATLVLIPKGPIQDPLIEVKARPICLLDEIGKILERIIADRINLWLEMNPEYDLSENQFGFCRNKSTVDALIEVKRFTQEAVSAGGVAIAVGLDITNAFNSIPWTVIMSAMESKRIPDYLRRLVGNYLSVRYVRYKTIDGTMEERPVRAGVPQGSVLGPLLWNIAFDSVLRLRLQEGCRIICYADDTLVVSSFNRLFGALVNVNLQVARVIRHISELGLAVAESKTEAVLFSKKRPNLMPTIAVGVSRILVRTSMKYLGVMIDGSWNFRDHFSYIEVKLGKVTRALNRLMPNLRGPCERRRRLYATVMTSVMTYAAPVWGEALTSSPYKIWKPLRRLQRTTAIRAIAAYRTVSFEAATLLSRMPPWLLEISLRNRVYLRVTELKRLGTLDPEEVSRIKEEESVLLARQWEILLSRPSAWGRKTITAILPHLKRWLERRHGQVTYHAAQMLTGHGSFLWRIGRREAPACFHCQCEDDSLEHTWFECPAWENARLRLIRDLNLVAVQHISLSMIIGKILMKETAWNAFMEFCNFVIRSKEEEERRREGLSPPSLNLSVRS